MRGGFWTGEASCGGGLVGTSEGREDGLGEGGGRPFAGFFAEETLVAVEGAIASEEVVSESLDVGGEGEDELDLARSAVVARNRLAIPLPLLLLLPLPSILLRRSRRTSRPLLHLGFRGGQRRRGFGARRVEQELRGRGDVAGGGGVGEGVRLWRGVVGRAGVRWDSLRGPKAWQGGKRAVDRVEGQIRLLLR